jgi:hypothetical protein
VWREILDMPSGAWGNQKKARPSKTLNRYKLSDMLFNSDTPDN